MKSNRLGYVKNLLLPCLGYSALTGAVTACVVFAFKWAAEHIISFSAFCYSYVAQNGAFIPLLLGAAFLLGLAASLILTLSPDSRGGGIPTVVAALRGLLPFAWLKSVFLVPLSAWLTFLCGVPLGNEGPCVQIGAALGEGTVAVLGKNSPAWRRYIMTGGACAGFAVATGSPLAGIFFAVEEAHRRLSPMIFMTASISVVSAQSIMLVLCSLTGTPLKMFDFGVLPALPTAQLWASVPIGIICGIAAIFFSRLYKSVGKFLNTRLARLPYWIKMTGIFLISSALGVVGIYFISSGHSLTEDIVLHGMAWYILLVCFAVRALLLMLANNIGVTGGLFIPTLTFGAIIGSLCAVPLISLGIIDAVYYPVLVIIGMTAFLGAASRIPLTACVFALEVLCGVGNIFPVIVGTAVALLIIEAVGEAVFSDVVIETRLEVRRHGKAPRIFDVFLTVKEGAFVVEKEIRDILWPATCTVLSIEKPKESPSNIGLGAGDILHVHYQSYEPNDTFRELEALVGVQSDDVRMKVHSGSDTHTVPENS